ncbi:MAG: glycoside hydrolase family 3 C-terminal domain-containing protein [Treponema sp.]|jgi:beta-glucosidase|nr:glycoside hydrolase family 3 C-terminal domain-containing protein [Treponema sp.]
MEDRAHYRELIGKMTLEEKASLFSGGGQFYTKAVTRLGIPALCLSDGPNGVRKQAGAADHLGLNASLPATCFPTASAMANSWDPELGEELGRRLGEEAAAQGVQVLLGPGLNIKRSPLCGRNFEYFSEDPYLAGKMAAAYIRGIQSRGTAACPKHFAANNQEHLRMHSDSIIDERTLHEIYLTGFEIAVTEGHPLSIMSSYNRINGLYASEAPWLLRETLVDRWGFSGFVLTDWGGSNDRVAALIAGNHLEMPANGGDSDRAIVDAVREGRVSESLLDERLAEYLKVLFALNKAPAPPAEIDVEEHHAFARRAARSCVTLLKNEEAILPLAPGTKVLVVGDFAATPRCQGAGSSGVNPFKVDSPLECLKAAGLDIAAYAPGFRRHGGDDPALRDAAVELARQGEAEGDIIILYLGLDEISETEGRDRSHLGINKNQIDLLEALSAANPRIVAVLVGGAPVETPWIDKCKALIHGYLGGQAGAGAMADILTGQEGPAGRLAETWPLSYQDTPAARYYPGEEKTAEYREGLYVGYRYYNSAGVPVRFPFGYGLTYTNFAYEGLEAGAAEVSFTLTNTGPRPGIETPQVYIGMKNSRVFRPLRELKGFARIQLAPGETRRVVIPLDEKAFRFFNPQSRQFEVEQGRYAIQVGASAEDIRLEAEIFVPGVQTAAIYDRTALPNYFAGTIGRVEDGEFEKLLGRPLPPALWDREKPLERNDTLAQLVYAKSPLGRLAHRILADQKTKAEMRGKPNLNILYIYNLPFRGLAKMTAGAVNMDMADAVLEIVNGHFFRGAGSLVKAWFRKGRDERKAARKLSAPW